MATMTEAEIEQAATRLVSELRGRQFGTSEVRTADFEIRFDHHDDRAVFFQVKMADPAPGHETWPPADLKELRAFYRSLLTRFQIPLVTFLRVESETPEEPWAEEASANEGA
jgi:hypothetical protein